jgi:hypothetical protein
MSVTNDDVMTRWEHHVRTGEPKVGRNGQVLSTRGRNILAQGDTLYSYGTHFVLARLNRDERGRPLCLLLNGDRFSVTTSQHQSWTRNVCQHLSSELGIPSLIVPFTALNAAGVSPGDVEPIHVRGDRVLTHHHSSKTRPGPLTMMDCPQGRTVVEKSYSYGRNVRDTETGRTFQFDGGTDRWREWLDTEDPDGFVWLDECPVPPEPSILTEDNAWHAHRERWRTEHSMHVAMRKPLQVPNPTRCYVGKKSTWLAAEFDGETWRWTTDQHLLGDSVFRARVRETVEVKPSPEQRELFALLTRLTGERRTLDEQIKALAPTHFRLRNRYNRRTGRYDHNRSQPRDWRETTRKAWQEAVLIERRIVADADWSATYTAVEESLRPGHRYQGQTRITRQRQRKPYFLSSFDYQERTPLYFLCELPAHVRPSTVDEAIEALKPPEVVAAEARGLTVTRQGDLFAIPTRLNKRQIRRLRNARHDFEKRLRVLGTNHSVTEGVICKGGAVLGRGIMRHEPDQWRDPDHARQRMGDGKTWHLLVRNTVPRS